MVAERLASILIVDDEASNLLILNQILKGRYTVYAARSGEAALRIAAEKSPELILLDVILPDINGLDVLSRLKSAEKTHDIPVVIISALTGEENTLEAQRRGAVCCIAKPFNVAEVKEKVAALLSRGG